MEITDIGWRRPSCDGDPSTRGQVPPRAAVQAGMGPRVARAYDFLRQDENLDFI